jgi:hypothetical protein
MSRSLFRSTFAVLVVLGLLSSGAPAQQKSKQGGHTPAQRVTGTKSVKSGPRNFTDAIPNLDKQLQSSRLPPEYRSVKPRLTPVKTAPTLPAGTPRPSPATKQFMGPASGLPARQTPIGTTTAEIQRPTRTMGVQGRPIEPGQQPAGNPWVATPRELQPSIVPSDTQRQKLNRNIPQSRIDPAIRELRTNDLDQSISGRRSLTPHTPRGPAGAAAPALGRRGFAANEPSHANPGQRTPVSLQRQNEVYSEAIMHAARPGSSVMVDNQGRLIRLAPNGTGIDRMYHNDRGELVQHSIRYGTSQSGETTVTHTFVDPSGSRTDTKVVDGPIASWSHLPTHQISGGGTQGDLKGATQPGSLQGSYTGQSISGGTQSVPKSDAKSEKPASPTSSPGTPPNNEKPDKETGTNGGPKKDASSPGVEGTGSGAGLGLAGGRALPAYGEGREVGDQPHRSQPDSVVQPTGPDDPSFRRTIRAPGVRTKRPEIGKGYIPTQQRPKGGREVVAQPAEGERSRPEVNTDEPLDVEAIRARFTNPVPAP